MRAINTFAGEVVTDIIRRQPASAARTAFAWQLAVGSTLARLTSVEMEGTTLLVTAADARWLKEIERARGTILPRLRQLLGQNVITKISTR